ncbi:unnamed protein product [Hydatigera taeniaeformis]|uniref:V-type proton ATPase subunit a n=1 Tax=Hydatigena taeniaeformis TaxID=6205 RepID=A0A0R3X4K2_HYDTA|nr:unnamed protein product [Hydatigera taeniaeformis]
MSSPRDAQVLEEFESQCDVGATRITYLGDVTDQFIDACRALDSWFIQKRLILTMERPEYQLVDEVADLQKELEIKTNHAKCLKQKIREYVSSINTIVNKYIHPLEFRLVGLDLAGAWSAVFVSVLLWWLASVDIIWSGFEVEWAGDGLQWARRRRAPLGGFPCRGSC